MQLICFFMVQICCVNLKAVWLDMKNKKLTALASSVKKTTTTQIEICFNFCNNEPDIYLMTELCSSRKIVRSLY